MPSPFELLFRNDVGSSSLCFKDRVEWGLLESQIQIKKSRFAKKDKCPEWHNKLFLKDIKFCCFYMVNALLPMNHTYSRRLDS